MIYSEIKIPIYERLTQDEIEFWVLLAIETDRFGKPEICEDNSTPYIYKAGTMIKANELSMSDYLHLMHCYRKFMSSDSIHEIIRNEIEKATKRSDDSAYDAHFDR